MLEVRYNFDLGGRVERRLRTVLGGMGDRTEHRASGGEEGSDSEGKDGASQSG